MMEKNMLVLYGSPRERGFTKELLKIFIQEWENVYPNTNIYTFHAYQENMAPCTACGFCRQKEGCSIPDINCLTHCIAMQMWWLWRRLYTVLVFPRL